MNSFLDWIGLTTVISNFKQVFAQKNHSHDATDINDISDAIQEVQTNVSIASTSATNATTSATNAASSASTASTKATNAANSATAAKTSETNASNSATKAESYAVGGTGSRTGEDTDNAKYYSQSAKTSATTATNNANTATTKANEAATSATSAKTSETNAANSATSAASSASTATTKATAAASSATSAANYATGSTNSAKYYYEQAKSISESFAGTLRPKGTVAFANLPTISSAVEGDMYNISDEFTTTSDFKEGAGNVVPAGTNVYKTADGKWDILAGTPVTGVKGNAESSYRRGNVNITAANVGALPISGGTMTGELVMKNVKLFDGAVNRTVMQAFDDEDDNNYGSELIVGGYGNTFIGGGECSTGLRTELIANGASVPNEAYIRAGEALYLVSDRQIFFESNANTVANRKCMVLDNYGRLTVPNNITTSSDSAETREVIAQNSLRTIKLAANATGVGYIWDTTNNKAIVTSTLDGTNTFHGNSESSTKLANARTIQTNLGNTSAASFNGTANVTPGITGTLPISHGGTGATTAAQALANLGFDSSAFYPAKGTCQYGIDYNSLITTSGIYEVRGTSDYPTQNSPTGNETDNNFYVQVFRRSSTFLTQIAISVRTDKSIYIRSLANTTWNDWVLIKASTATKLATARTIRTNLASTSTASFDGSANVTPGVTGTLPVANGGTGATTLPSGYALIGNGTSAVSSRAITDNTARGTLGWGSGIGTNLVTLNTIAYWNGLYNGSSSNLAYCVKGAFGTAATYDVTTSATSGSTALITSGAVYSGLAAKQANLGFTPVQQGGGTGQLTNKVYIGWSGSRLKAHVDNTDMGNIVFDNHLAAASVNYATSAGSASTATTATKLGSSTVGGAAKPIYLNAGTATACSSTIGSSTLPVYMNGGTITACGTSLGVSVTGSSASCTGNAATATKLATARTIQTNLGSTSSASFNGTANVTPGITGTLPISHGGTGATTAADAINKLGGLAISGASQYVNPVSNVNTFYSGIGLFSGEVTNLPTTEWWLIISGGQNGTTTQIAYTLFNTTTPRMRYCASGTWSSWQELNNTTIGGKTILHKGNSVPVVISSSAPSDTSALWAY